MCGTVIKVHNFESHEESTKEKVNTKTMYREEHLEGLARSVP